MKWFEDYRCGCVSDLCDCKSDLLGFCAIHGADRRGVYKEWSGISVKDEGDDL